MPALPRCHSAGRRVRIRQRSRSERWRSLVAKNNRLTTLTAALPRPLFLCKDRGVSPVSLDIKLLPRQGLRVQAVGDSALVVDLDSGKCFELNRMGVEVWQLIAQGTTSARICAALSERFSVDPAILRTDVGKLVDDLASHGLLEGIR